MADENVVAVEPGQGQWDYVFSVIKRFAIMYFISQMIGKFFFKSQQDSTNILKFYSKFSTAQEFNLLSFIVEYDQDMKMIFTPRLIWELPNLRFNDWKQGPTENSTFNKSVVFELSENMKKNGSVHIFTCASEVSSEKFILNRKMIINYCDEKVLTKYRKYKRDTKKLLVGTHDSEDIQADPLFEDGEIVSYWHEDIHINVMYDLKSFTQNEIVPPFNKHIKTDTESLFYYPVVYLNDYWNYYRDYLPIHESNRSLTLNMTFYPLSFFKWQLYLAQGMHNQFPFMDIQGDPENSDQIKRLIKETNLYILILTFSVSILHGIFEFLAFKNDIQFWRTRSSHEGLSLSTLVMGIFQAGVVFLYVMDNETNYMIMVSCGIGFLIEIWKVNRIFKFSYRKPYDNLPLILPVIKLRVVTSEQSETQEYDKQAIKYLSVLLLPLMIGYTIYSLFYTPHKGWYSFILSVIYGYLLTFGFIMMTPQLFINYKMKSVAHLPWRMLTYKALNTFVDDIFAFVIKMPILYRIGCFRDDIVFLIFIYQKWIYPTDMNRVNEFGCKGAVDEQEKIEITDAKHDKID